MLELDDIAYALFLSRTAKNITEGMPPLNEGMEEGGKVKECGRFCGFAFLLWLVLGAVILFLLVVLIATSSRSGGGVASRGFQYKATLPTAPKGPKPTKKEIQQLKERARGAALV